MLYVPVVQSLSHPWPVSQMVNQHQINIGPTSLVRWVLGPKILYMGHVKFFTLFNLQIRKYNFFFQS